MKRGFSMLSPRYSDMSTHTDDDLVSTLQFSDSFFPLGSYSLSFGIETLSQLGLVKGTDDVSSILSVFLEQLSTLDCVALRGSFSAAGENDLRLLVAIDRKLASFKNVKEFSEASRRTGRALLRTVRALKKTGILSSFWNLVESGKAPGNYAVCLAIACSTLGIGEERAVILLLYTSAVSLLGASVRLGLVTHVQAQQILHSTKDELMNCARRSSAIAWSSMHAFSPMLDVMGMQHVYLQSRMFYC